MAREYGKEEQGINYSEKIIEEIAGLKDAIRKLNEASELISSKTDILTEALEAVRLVW